METPEKPLQKLKWDVRQANRVAKHFLTTVEVQPGQTYLDVGCGDGSSTRPVAEQHQLTVVGVDSEATVIALAQQHAGNPQNLTFEVADAERLPFAAESFDFVFSCKALHHINNWPAAVSEMARVLKPGGALCVSDLRFPWCRKYISQRWGGELSSFPWLPHVRAAAREAGLQEQTTRKRFLDYDTIWLKQ